MGLSEHLKTLEKIDRLARNLKIPSTPVSADDVEFADKLIRILRNDDKTSITIALHIARLIDKYEGRAV